MPKRRKWLLVPLVWLILVIVFLEVGLRLVGPDLPGPSGALARQIISGEPFHESWTPAWQHDNDHYYALRPNLDNVLQYGSPSSPYHVSTVQLWDSSIGFRTRPYDNYAVDAVVLGDSFGFCITEYDDCWVPLLENATGMGIVNLSQWGTGTTSRLRILNTYGAPFEPPLVLWQFFGNDFNDDYGLAVLREETAELADESDNPLAQPPEQLSYPVLDWLRNNSVAFAVLEVALTGNVADLQQGGDIFLGRYRVTYRDGALEFGQAYEQVALDMRLARNQVGLQFSRQAFMDAGESVAGWGGQLVVIVIPTREEVYEHLTAPIMGEEGIAVLSSAREVMLDLCDELDLLCLDVLPFLQERALQGEHLYYTDDLHLNAHGNAVLAEVVQMWLAEQALWP